jgi:hypothetical protein
MPYKEKRLMPDFQPPTIPRLRHKISLDTWAVLLALLAAILIRAGVITKIPW